VGLGFRVWVLGFRVWVLGFRVWGIPFPQTERVKHRFRVQGLGFLEALVY